MNILDVPFHSSGAINQSHYAIVRRVETAESTSTANRQIFLEIKAVQERLHLGLSMERCKESLIILLYCATVVSPGFLPGDAFEFAFRYAINLAEAGRTNEDKRIGYLICSEMMPMDHELRIMLVNTLHKDLESNNTMRICMALDNIIVAPNTTVVSVVQPLLQKLLTHSDPHVRRRTLFALRVLSESEPALVYQFQNTIVDQLADEDDSVANATLALLSDYPPQNAVTHSRAKHSTGELLQLRFSRSPAPNAALILHCLEAIRTLGLADSTIPLLHDILQMYSSPNARQLSSRAVILECFKILRQHPDAFTSRETSACISSIKHFIRSEVANDVYLFLSCLECIDATIWAGTSSDRAPSLQAEDFERILQQLNSKDKAICRKAMRLVGKVDPSLLDMQLSLLSQVSSLKDIDTCLDIILIRYNEDGGQYAVHVLELAENADKAVRERVSRKFLERVLVDIRTSQNVRFKTTAVIGLVQVLIDPDAVLSSTAIIFSSALTVEFLQSLPFTPGDILNGILHRLLKTWSTTVQELLLAAMLYVSAHCNEISPDTLRVVDDMSKHAVQPVREHCNQFIAYSQRKDELVQILLQSASTSLSDFLISLQNHWSAKVLSTRISHLTQDASGGSPTITIGAPLIDFQISRTDLLSPESPFQIFGMGEGGNFSTIWSSLEGQCDMRGWSKNTIPTIKRLLDRLTDDSQFQVVSATIHTFQGEVDLLILSTKTNDVEAALRLQQSDDSSCLWRLRSTDVSLGARVRRTLNQD